MLVESRGQPLKKVSALSVDGAVAGQVGHLRTLLLDQAAYHSVLPRQMLSFPAPDCVKQAVVDLTRLIAPVCIETMLLVMPPMREATISTN